jgi:voltage-gated potassium channel
MGERQGAKRRVYEWVEFSPSLDGRRTAFDLIDSLMIVLILANVVTVMLETVPGVQARCGPALWAFEVASMAVFTVEYLVHLWVCTENPKYAGRRWPRLRFAVSPMAVIDLLAIAPFYVGLFFPSTDLRFVLALRLVRMLRVLKIGRYSAAAGTLARVLKGKREELSVMLLVTAVLLVVASGLMYYAEHAAQPDKFSSIPAAMWWAVITLTTIGYGDVFPTTTLGQWLGGAIAVCGIGLVALPTAIVASGFAEEVARKRKVEEEAAAQVEAERRCPHCGKLFSEEPHATPAAGG